MYSCIEARIHHIRVGRQAEPLLGLEPLHRLHQTDVAFGNDFADGQAVAAISHRDLGDEAKMRRDKLVGGVRVLVLTPALREHVFLLGLEHRKFPDFGEVAG